jgi:uncharacterized protein YcfJ
MNRLLKNALAVAAVAIATHATAQVTFYQDDGFRGQSFTTDRDVGNFQRFGFNDRASSVVVQGERWEVCEDARFEGRCVVLRPGRYPSLSAMGLNDRISSARAMARDERAGDNRVVPGAIVQDNARPGAQITFYEHDGFQGQAFTADRAIEDFSRFGFNDRTSSIDVRGDNWVVCEDIRYGGRCMILQPGRYPSLSAMGLNDRISSVRRADVNDRVSDNRNEPIGAYDYRRRGGEQTFEANVTSVRAVVATPQQRCWVEREQISPNNTHANVPGALAGAVIGGILGHQIGGGGGRDAATALGVLGGAAIGANVGRDSSGQQTYTQDVQRCDRPVGQVRPDYWDVVYVFRGREFQVQMVAPPGPTVTVNSEGEPRV